MTLTSLFLLLKLLLTPALAQELRCNGMEKLCNRGYNQVVFPTTHNSTSLGAGSGPDRVLFVPNQNRTIQEQLNDGVRGFMIDLWYWKGQVYTCHRYCELGGQPLLLVMQTFQKFMESNPNEVVTIIFENYVSGADLEKVFMEAGLLSTVHTQVSGEAWPTLGEMIHSKKRLVIFKEFEDEGPAWDMIAWKYAVESQYSYQSIEEFTCDFGRGHAENSLYILNQFITVAFFRETANLEANQLSTLMDRAHLCLEQKQKVPNFLTVDFYTEDLITAAKKLNEEATQ